MRHKARNAPVPVEERVNPEEAVMRRSDGLDFPQVGEVRRGVSLVEARQKTPELIGFRRHVFSYHNVMLAALAGDDGQSLACIGIFDPQHRFR